MSQKSYYTQTSLAKVKNQLEMLKTKERKAIAQQIKEAIDKGDLSENAEYHAAKEAQGLLEMKISQLQDQITHARIIDESNIDTSSVSILTHVKIKNQHTKQIYTYKIVPPQDVNIKKGFISSSSPIAKGLLNKKIGQTATIQVPAGTLIFEILSISL